MTPREHMAAAIAITWNAALAHGEPMSNVEDDRNVASNAGVAYGHAFRALEILYDEREQALREVRHVREHLDRAYREYDDLLWGGPPLIK